MKPNNQFYIRYSGQSICLTLDMQNKINVFLKLYSVFELTIE